MATTVNQILDRAYGFSLRNRQGAILNEQNEAISVINRLVIEAFLAASQVNPAHFGLADEVDYAGSPINGWPRPARALSVYRVETVLSSTVPSAADGVRVVPVPDDDLSAVTLHPSIIERGGVFYPNAAGAAGSPTGGKLRFLYCRTPNMLVVGGALSQEIDSGFPDHMTGLIETQLALYLAQKDQRVDEIPGLQGLVGGWANAWSAYLQTTTPATVRRFAPRIAVTPETSVSD